LIWIDDRDPPSLGRWTAFFVDLQYDCNPGSNSNNPGKSTEKSKGWQVGKEDVYVFTTEVSIVPRIFPFLECYLCRRMFWQISLDSNVSLLTKTKA
jgi:hypothetical protein